MTVTMSQTANGIKMSMRGGSYNSEKKGKRKEAVMTARERIRQCWSKIVRLKTQDQKGEREQARYEEDLG